MSATAFLIVGVAVLGVAWLGGVYLLREFADWARQREAERASAASFERDFIPEAADVAPVEAETDVLLSQVRADAVLETAVCADLDNITQDLRQLGVIE